MLLGERLPRPPKDVPQLPDDEAATEGLPCGRLVEKHSSDPNAPSAISASTRSALRWKASTPSAAAAKTTWATGRSTRARRPWTAHEFDGLDGLRNYLLTTRRDAFLRQFCRKLLGYALGRGVQLSDDPLFTEMQAELEAKDYKVEAARWRRLSEAGNFARFGDVI